MTHVATSMSEPGIDLLVICLQPGAHAGYLVQPKLPADTNVSSMLSACVLEW